MSDGYYYTISKVGIWNLRYSGLQGMPGYGYCRGVPESTPVIREPCANAAATRGSASLCHFQFQLEFQLRSGLCPASFPLPMEGFSRFLLLLFLLPLKGIAEAPLLYKNALHPVDVRVQDLLSRMTLDEKIGQMIQIERDIANESNIREYFVGSLLSGGGSVPATGASPSMWADMVDGFQKAALGTRLGIPLIYGIDAVHGHNNVYGATIFPHNIGLGCTRDPDLVRRIGVATALEVRGTGIQYVFAPCIAVCRHPGWGRCYESYSENPDLVRNMTEIIVGLQGKPQTPGHPFIGGQQNVVASAKHFVGDGGTVEGVDESNTISSYKRLVKIHMVPYFDAIAKGVATVMISYSSWNGQKMHGNHFLVSHVLKQQLGFKGFVISDWQGIDRITNPPGSNYSASVYGGVNAGIDMIMIPYDIATFVSDLKAHVSAGRIHMSRINDAVSRILRVKFIAGLFEHPLANRSLLGMIGAESHRQLAREAVRKSAVLLKNGDSSNATVLPLSKNAQKILVAGSHADNIGYQCGGWTISWQGSSGNITKGTTILSAIKASVSKSTEVVYEESPDVNLVKEKGFSYAVVVIGEVPYAEMFGDSKSLAIPELAVQTIQNVCNSVTCVVVLISGRPLVVEPYLATMDAFVAAWLPGTEGQGVADVLFGDYQFKGKLSRTWFKRADQLPMNVGDKNYDPLFPYGFGLSTGEGTLDLSSGPSSSCSLQIPVLQFFLLLLWSTLFLI